MTEFSELERKTLDSQYFIRGIVPEWDSKIDEFSYESQMRREKGNCHLDIRYGDHSRQVLDVFKPQNQKPGALPVFVFFHGGFFFSKGGFDDGKKIFRTFGADLV